MKPLLVSLSFSCIYSSHLSHYMSSSWSLVSITAAFIVLTTNSCLLTLSIVLNKNLFLCVFSVCLLFISMCTHVYCNTPTVWLTAVASHSQNSRSRGWGWQTWVSVSRCACICKERVRTSSPVLHAQWLLGRSGMLLEWHKAGCDAASGQGRRREGGSSWKEAFSVHPVTFSESLNSLLLDFNIIIKWTGIPPGNKHMVLFIIFCNSSSEYDG